jgi:hypothetical protein
MFRKLFSVVLIALMTALGGCYTAGHGGRTTDTRGLETSCAGGCAEFKSDGTGCARFHKGTSETCSAYFTQVCAAAPKQCSNK